MSTGALVLWVLLGWTTFSAVLAGLWGVIAIRMKGRL
jgi:TRAP-type mannitol/chloroaromatic compound transport system permease large subunit